MALGIIQKFLAERGVRALRPDRPRVEYKEYWSREMRWLTAAEHAESLVRTYGPAKAREILNLAVGETFFFTDERLIPQLGKIGTYGFILMPGGCEWALKPGGRCRFCEFQEAIDEVVGKLEISDEEFFSLFRCGFATMREEADMVNVFTGGSFLNPGEIPLDAQARMALGVAGSDKPSILRVESRVQYIVEETVAPLIDILKPAKKTLDIAIGFETQDEELRNKKLIKGMSKAGFTKAVETAKRLGAKVSAYIILMPVDMSERHAIEECVASIRYVFATGVDEVLLQARYSHHPDVKAPKLWSIARVLRETADLGPVMLGQWEGELPAPVVWPRNCEACTPRMMELLVNWRRTLDPKTFADGAMPTCDCRNEWQREIEHNEATGKLPVV